jgi:hypothetical protein
VTPVGYPLAKYTPLTDSNPSEQDDTETSSKNKSAVIGFSVTPVTLGIVPSNGVVVEVVVLVVVVLVVVVVVDVVVVVVFWIDLTEHELKVTSSSTKQVSRASASTCE